ncbi:10046_t:CDS:2 [Paraglomus occultum]|uniref:10046_t:CDS:1 n=1 Tax=Paraglomus occultum TaxID=144539 RepID=A0A9N9AYE9_9GLOM|nr:10046_t:CDS:2 [Paraglomus occultum]
MELVASVMRVCLHITEDRGTILSTYLSEPTLTEAAAYIMNIDNGLLVPDLLTMLINSIKEGVAEASYCGELYQKLETYTITTSSPRMKLSPEFAGITNKKCTAHIAEDIGILPEVDQLCKLVLSEPTLLKRPADNAEIPLKKVKIGRTKRNPSDTSVSSAIRQTFQVSLAVYGLGKEVYACFNFTAIGTQTQVLMSLRKLLVAWPDAAELEDDSKRVQRITY